MAEPKRNPLVVPVAGNAFVQRFILAEILGPPKALDRRSGPELPRERQGKR